MPIIYQHVNKEDSIILDESGNCYIGIEAHNVMFKIQTEMRKNKIPNDKYDYMLKRYLEKISSKSDIWKQINNKQEK